MAGMSQKRLGHIPSYRAKTQTLLAGEGKAHLGGQPKVVWASKEDIQDLGAPCGKLVRVLLGLEVLQGRGKVVEASSWRSLVCDCHGRND